VREVLEILRSGLDECLIGLGHGSIHDLTPADVVIPDGFVLTDWEDTVIDVSDRAIGREMGRQVPGPTSGGSG
jgi:hypothetical protein